MKPLLERLLEPVSPASGRRWLGGTFVGALAFRVLLFYSGLVDVVFDTGDSFEYRDLARSMLEHHVFGWDGVPKMNRTPGYPAFLAALYATVGGSQRAVTTAQIVLDALTCVMVVHIAMKMRLGRLGVAVTGVLASTCIFTASFAYQEMTETFYTFVLVASMWVLPAGGFTSIFQKKARWRVALCGLLLGVATLVRPAHLVCAPFLVAVLGIYLLRILRRRIVSKQVLVVGALLTATTTLVVVPWMVRNRVVFHAEYDKPDHSHVTLMGFKTDVPHYRHWYTEQFMVFRRSYEEPFVMIRPYEAPTVIRYVYPGEEEDVKKAFDALSAEVRPLVEKDTGASITPATLEEFRRIGDKRYATHPRLHATAPISRVLKLWIVPRVSVIKQDQHGGTVGLPLVVGLTLYDCVYVLPGLVGLAFRPRGGRPIWAAIVAAIVAQTLLYALWHSAPQSRYMIPLFPVLCIGCGVVVLGIVRRVVAWRAKREGRPARGTADVP